MTICHGLKLEAADGKKYRTHCGNTEGIFRIIQSILSHKAEPLTSLKVIPFTPLRLKASFTSLYLLIN